MKVRYIFFSFFIIFLFILSGCSNSECKVAEDCGRSSTCITYSCVDKVCDKTVKENCCGNGLVESGENECTCSKDVGECKLNESFDSEIFEASCDTGECLVAVKSDSVEKDISKPIDLRDFEMLIKISYDDPFNVKASTFNVEFELTNMLSTTSQPKITKIQLVGTKGRQQITLAEKDINRILWVIGSKVNEEIYVEADIGSVEENMPITAIVSYEFIKSDPRMPDSIIRGDVPSIRVTATRELLRILNPSIDYPCDPVLNCNDGNPGTRDSCAKDGTSFCNHVPIPNRVGNYICDVGENKCTAPQDCGPCPGERGEFLKTLCSEQNECIITTRITPNEKTIVKQKGIALSSVNIYSTFFEPHDYKKVPLKVEIRLMDMESKLVPPVVIEQIDVTSYGDGELLASVSPTSGNVLSNVFDSVFVDIPLQTTITNNEEVKKLQYQVSYTYSTENGAQRSSFSDSVGEVTLVDVD